MLVKQIYLIVIPFFMTIILSIITDRPFLSGVITLIVVMAGYIVLAQNRGRKRLHLLEENCNPQAFIEATNKQLKLVGKNRTLEAYLLVDLAAGYIIMGEIRRGQEILNAIDKTRLSPKYGALLVYTMNQMVCHYELGEIEQAEKLFETQIPMLSPVNKRQRLAMELLMADRLFFLKRFEESMEKYVQLKQEKISRRKQLEIIYRMGQIEDARNNMEAAEELFQKVADNGKDLYVGQQATQYINRNKASL